ncbi:MAG: CpsD/CapB family tyrosine-protein kinase [Acidobacteriota bacterium]|nr:CpsD/CapB family tyrosine-protein kinase [Acidobacteriota bacterium]
MEKMLEIVTSKVTEPRRTKPFRDEARSQEEGRQSQSLEKLDFKYYALSPSGVNKLEGRDTNGLRARREALAQPSREVSLNLFHVAPNLVTLHEHDLRASEQYDMLALRLISGTSERLFKRVLITSAQKGEGRTSVLLNLAGALSKAGKKVLVVDTDLVRPSVIRLLGIESQIGLAEAYKRDLPPGSAIVKVMPGGFHVLPTRERIDNAVEIITSPAFQEMLEILDPGYDFILFDSPPLMERADCSMLIKLVDTALIVIRQGKTGTSQMAKAIGLLSEEDIFGVVLNRIAN